MLVFGFLAAFTSAAAESRRRCKISLGYQKCEKWTLAIAAYLV
jgi:hypothetical protein